MDFAKMTNFWILFTYFTFWCPQITLGFSSIPFGKIFVLFCLVWKYILLIGKEVHMKISHSQMKTNPALKYLSVCEVMKRKIPMTMGTIFSEHQNWIQKIHTRIRWMKERKHTWKDLYMIASHCIVWGQASDGFCCWRRICWCAVHSYSWYFTAVW